MYRQVASSALKHFPQVIKWGMTFGSGIFFGVYHSHLINPSIPSTQQKDSSVHYRQSTTQPQYYTKEQLNAAALLAYISDTFDAP